ncbi:MAG: MerC domain-containing protein [Pseudomonadota bacterium]
MISTASRGPIDLISAGLSAACIIHCLALPLLGAVSPILASWSEIEWIHKGLVLTAAPLSLAAIIGRSSTRGGQRFALIAMIGLALLIAAVFVERLHDYERPLTVLGGIILGGAHIAWWLSHRHRRDNPQATNSS